MSHITTHVLDTGTGRPAQGITAQLSAQSASGWDPVAEGITDSDGRIRSLGPEQVDPGIYRITFATGRYFDSTSSETFFPEVILTFSVTGTEHYHVPLLLSPFAYSTYRGS